MPMIKAVIFDMDGVLIDSVELGIHTRKKLLAHYNVDLDTVPDPQGEDHRASSLKTLLSDIKNYCGIHIDHDEFAGKIRGRLREDLQEYKVAVDPALVTFLEELKQHNIICAIASSGLRGGVDIKLDFLGIRQYFSVIVTGSDVKDHKPNPEPYLYTMKKLNLSPEDCIIFEDSLTGIQAGIAAGCKVIGFTQYNPPKEPSSEVTAAIKDWNEISYKKLERLFA